ncbi:hypothetical protein RRG08_052791 [Elysia crispata]|uniref:Uncharacterized protein n=1 Tax=Elysia crispata TaxID=231223 RepID=A0AAE1B690_9GAST|nr:hypothetical protein RRG08_052791 [Elysia crispata]
MDVVRITKPEMYFVLCGPGNLSVAVATASSVMIFLPEQSTTTNYCIVWRCYEVHKQTDFQHDNLYACHFCFSFCSLSVTRRGRKKLVSSTPKTITQGIDVCTS